MKAHSQAGPEMAVAAHVRQPAVRAPGPVADDRINETGNADAVEKIANETGASDHGAGGDGRAGVGKSELEDPNRQERHAGTLVRGGSILQEEPVIADEAVAVCEHEREPDGVKQNAAEARVHHAFHENVHGFAGSAETGFQHRESDLHTEDQERGDQRPHGIDRVDDVVAFQVGIRGEGVSAYKNGYEADDAQNQCNADTFSGKQQLAVAPPFRIPQPHAQPGKFLR